VLFHIAHFITSLIPDILRSADPLAKESIPLISIVAHQAITCIEVKLRRVANAIADVVSDLFRLADWHTVETNF
jgi:hypothetical protein